MVVVQESTVAMKSVNQRLTSRCRPVPSTTNSSAVETAVEDARRAMSSLSNRGMPLPVFNDSGRGGRPQGQTGNSAGGGSVPCAGPGDERAHTEAEQADGGHEGERQPGRNGR